MEAYLATDIQTCFLNFITILLVLHNWFLPQIFCVGIVSYLYYFRWKQMSKWKSQGVTNFFPSLNCQAINVNEMFNNLCGWCYDKIKETEMYSAENDEIDKKEF